MRKIVIAALIALLAPSGVSAQAVVGKPVYNPETKSYFELYSYPDPEKHGTHWGQHDQVARSKVFNGVHGRLAVVPSKSVNDWLRKTFRPDQGTFIGLRYFCNYRKLAWSSGDELKKDAYTNWGRHWNTEGTSSRGIVNAECLSFLPYLPVHYWPVQEGFIWNANGPQKYFMYSFIEYPTGKP